jgi:hypothetical protein
MSILRRFVRYFQAQREPRLGEGDRVGIAGELYADQFLTAPNIVSYVRNPVLPHPNDSHLVLETDFVVYASGNLFCLEIKNYKGRISYADPQHSRIIQQKEGRYGESIEPKIHHNPLRQTRRFIFHLKSYLSTHVDRQFAKLYITPVAAFVRNPDTDISAVRDSREALIYVDEISEFFLCNGNRNFSDRPSHWIVQGLHQLPRPDVVVTIAGDVFRCFIHEHEFVFKVETGQRMALPYRQLHDIRLKRSGSFSDFDRVVVTLKDGQQQRYASIGGIVQFRTLQGKDMSEYIRNIVSITPGVPFLFQRSLGSK